MEAPHVAQVCRSVESVHVPKLVVCFPQVDRPVRARAKPRVDTLAGVEELCACCAIRRKAVTTRFRDLHEHKTPSEFRTRIEQPLDSEKLLVDTLGVVQPIDPYAQSNTPRQLKVTAHEFATFARWWCRALDFASPHHTNRIGSDVRRLASIPHGALHEVHFSVKGRLDAPQKIATVLIGLQPDDVAAEEALQKLAAPRAGSEHAGTRPGNMPEGDDGA